MEIFQQLWNDRRFTGTPINVGVNLFDLIPEADITPSLFAQPNRRQALGLAVDKINNKFGKNAVYVASGHAAKDAAEEKIAFTKVEMFNEGAPVNEVLKERSAAWREKRLG